MTDRSEQAKSIFQDALDRTAAERDAFAQAACAGDEALLDEVRGLLAAFAGADSFLAEPGARPTGGGETAGAVIGRYKLIEPVGEGGFGVVWKAQQAEPVRRVVALKIIKLGMDTNQVVARFEAERQALALMDHPNIARVFDGGATATGRPYFVMEYVKGLPITAYCDHVGMEPEARLRLFRSVCLAVQHAHQKGVIHRDLKPGNIMVAEQDGEPVVKVIDFGIAKATDHDLTQRTLFTGIRQMIGTPDYMAPEQTALSNLDIDTRADVYSLGVVLYELLTGARPFELTDLREAGIDEVLRRIREDEPPRPSSRLLALGERLPRVAADRRTDAGQLGRLLRGDLDWIVLRAMAKDRNRRYPTAVALCEDIDRHLEDLPVLAGPPSASYRLRKFVQRHGTAVMAAAAILLVLVAGSVAVLLALDRAVTAEQEARVEATRADEAAATARTESRLAREMLVLMQEMLESANPHTKRGPDYTLRQLLDDFGSRLRRNLVEDPGVEAALRTTIGNAYRSLGLYEPAEDHLRAALAATERVHGEQAPETARARYQWAHMQHDRGAYEEALATLRTASGALAAAAEPGTETELELLDHRGFEVDLLRHLGRLDEAEAVGREALAKARALGEPARRRLPNLLHNLAITLKDDRELEAAAELLAEAETVLADLPGASELTLASQLIYRGSVLRELGQSAQARDCASRALALSRERLGDEHPQTISCRHLLGMILAAEGDHAGAVEHLEQAVDAFAASVGPDHPQTASCRTSLATSLRALGRHADAIAQLEAAHRAYRTKYGPDSLLAANAANALARELSHGGRTRPARRLYAEARGAYEKHFGRSHIYTLRVRVNHAQSLSRDREFAAAAADFAEIVQLLAQAETTDLFRASVRLVLAHVLAAGGHGEEALAAAEAAARLLAGAEGNHEMQTRLLVGRGEALSALGRHDEAIAALEQALTAGQAHLPGMVTRWEAELELGRALGRAGREGAAAHVEAAFAVLGNNRGSEDWRRRGLHALIEVLGGAGAGDADRAADLERYRGMLAEHEAAIERAQEGR